MKNLEPEQLYYWYKVISTNSLLLPLLNSPILLDPRIPVIVRTREESDYFKGINVIYGNAPDTEVVSNPWDAIDLLYTGMYRIEQSQLVRVLEEIQNEICHLEPENRKQSFLIETDTLFDNIATFKMNLIAVAKRPYMENLRMAFSLKTGLLD